MNVAKLVEKGIKEYYKNNFVGSLELYKKALKSTNPQQVNTIIFYNIGLSYYSLMNYNQAFKYFEKSFKLGNLKSGWELSMTKLHLGDINGLDYFSYRYFGSLNSFPNLPLKKISNLEDIQNAKNILVLNEQGFGDEILFSRGLHLLEGKKFSYQVYSHMMPLFKVNFDGNFFDSRTLQYDFVVGHDSWIPTGDLFKLHTLNNGFAYKSFNSEQKSNKVGICFKTNKLSKNSDLRSIDYQDLKKVLTKFDYEYISLQKDFIFDFAENKSINNFQDTSDIIDECQFVITVDTVIAHLAAIKNKKVYLIWKEYKDWRWNYPFYGQNIELVNFKDLENKLNQLK